MHQVFTVGYEAATPEAFDSELLAHGVELVVDVRAVAASRRAGFSKRSLSEHLSEAGIDYVHLRGLGDPKAGRVAARAGYWQEFRRIFAAQMSSAEAKSDLAKLVALVRSQRVALLCYEADPATCHRSIVAAEVARIANVEVAHLHVSTAKSAELGPSRANHHPGESRAAP